LIFKTLSVGPFQCNCRILACPRTGEALLIDPGDEADRILKSVSEIQAPSGAPLTVKYLLHTHGHLDHIAASREVKEKLRTPELVIHQADEEIYRNLPLQAQLFGLSYGEPLPIDRFVEHEEELRVGDLRFSVIHTPGHSPGSVGFRLREDSASGASEILFSGDTLFQGSVGRTDLWGANQEQMFKMIHERLMTLDDDTRVCPGHGPDTRIGIEKRENPFLR
jgi:glyoxylase-like metal-dependent hydrolase (beta-lactamase superfamily II)